ncbi:MAG: AsmA-like C-terminal region-containing protein [Candidatus Omnitrophota bacterium]
MKKRIILLILLVLFISTVVGLYYFAKNVLPRLAREKITTELAKVTQSKVILGDIKFSLLRGLVFEKIVVFDKDDVQKELCSVTEASANFLILPFFKEKKIVIPTLSIDGASLMLVRQKDNTFNLSYLLDQFKQSKPQGKAPAVLVRTVKVSDAKISLTDASFDPAIAMTAVIRELSAQIHLNKIAFKSLLSLAKQDRVVDFEIQADYFLSEQKLAGAIAIKDLDITTYAEYLKSAPFQFEKARLFNAKIDGSFDIQKRSAQGKLSLERGTFKLNNPFPVESTLENTGCDFSMDETSLKLKALLHLKETSAQKDTIRVNDLSAKVNATIDIPLETNENLKISYEGNILITGGLISGLPSIDKISDIISELKFKNSDVVIESLNAKVFDAPVTAKGSLKNNLLNVDVTGNFDLKTILPILTKDLHLPSLELTGTTDLTAHIVADTSGAASPEISGEANLAGVRLKLPENNINLSSDKGRVKFDLAKQDAQWHFEAVEYLNEDYSFDGTIKDFTTPAVHAVVVGRELKVQADVVKKAQLLNITSLKAQWRSCDVNLKGQYDLQETLSIGGLIILDFVDLKALAPQAKEALDKMGLEGRLFLTTDAKGPVKDYTRWDIKAKGKSTAVKIYGLKAQNITLQYSQYDKTGYLNELMFDAYQGRGSVNGRLNLGAREIPYTFNAILENIDIKALKADTTLKDKNIYGILGANLHLSGTGADTNLLRGNGSFAIKDGNLWEFNPLQGLGNFIFLPRFSSIVFSRAQGDLSVQNGYVETDNLEFLGSGLGLIAEGKIYLDGKLDLLINSQIIPPGPQAATEVISKAASLSAIKVTGTVQKPKYTVQPIAQNIIKKLGDAISSILP